MLITANNWKQFASTISAPSDPIDYCQEAVNCLMDKLDNHVVRVKGIKPQFKAENQVKIIDFITAEGRKYYDDAMERFRKKKAKIESMTGQAGYNAKAEMRVALLQFRIAAESNPDRAKIIVDAMYDAVMNHNQAAVAAFNFKISISKCIKMLLEPPYNVPREKISVIWGGSVSTLSQKKKLKKAILGNEDLLAALGAADINLDDINLGDDDVQLFEEIDFAPELKLGSQNRAQRQNEIDRFQKGESLFCFFSFKSGGVGLSLHHTDEWMPKELKCRRKESGYVYTEDIPRVTTRQRILFSAPTYSAIELVQGLGRCPRLTSLSNTPQLLLFFAGTIEERVSAIVNMKLKCLSHIIRMKEDWNDIVTGDRTAYEKHAAEKLITEGEDDDTLINANGSDDDE